MFLLNLANGDMIDATGSKSVVGNGGLKGNKPCLTFSSKRSNTIEIVPFEDVESVQTSNGTIELDHTKPIDILVEEFETIQQEEESKDVLITFTDMKMGPGPSDPRSLPTDIEIKAKRTETIEEAFKKTNVPVPAGMSVMFMVAPKPQPMSLGPINGEGPVNVTPDTLISELYDAMYELVGPEIEMTGIPVGYIIAKMYPVTINNFDNAGNNITVPNIAPENMPINLLKPLLLPHITAVPDDPHKIIKIGYIPDTEFPDRTVEIENCHEPVTGPLTFVVSIDWMPM